MSDKTLPSALLCLGLDHDSLGHSGGIALEVHDLCLGQDGLLQRVQIHPFQGRDLDDLHVTAVFLRGQAVAHQVVQDAWLTSYQQLFLFHNWTYGVGELLVALVDRDDDRGPGGKGVVDGLDRLGHDAVVLGHDENDNVGEVGTTGAHVGERDVAGGVEEGDAVAAGQVHEEGTDVLRDAACFARRNGRLSILRVNKERKKNNC